MVQIKRFFATHYKETLAKWIQVMNLSSTQYLAFALINELLTYLIKLNEFR